MWYSARIRSCRGPILKRFFDSVGGLTIRRYYEEIFMPSPDSPAFILDTVDHEEKYVERPFNGTPHKVKSFGYANRVLLDSFDVARLAKGRVEKTSANEFNPIKPHAALRVRPARWIIGSTINLGRALGALFLVPGYVVGALLFSLALPFMWIPAIYRYSKVGNGEMSQQEWDKADSLPTMAFKFSRALFAGIGFYIGAGVGLLLGVGTCWLSLAFMKNNDVITMSIKNEEGEDEERELTGDESVDFYKNNNRANNIVYGLKTSVRTKGDSSGSGRALKIDEYEKESDYETKAEEITNVNELEHGQVIQEAAAQLQEPSSPSDASSLPPNMLYVRCALLVRDMANPGAGERITAQQIQQAYTQRYTATAA